jgi:transposase
MAAPRRVVEFSIAADERARLEAIARSRTDAAIRVERARMLLAYHANPSSVAVGERIGVMRHTVRRCVRRAEQVGVMAALDDSPRPGKAPVITPEARAWLVSLACQKAKDLGYPHELWTTRLLARHARAHAQMAGHPCMANIVQGTVCKILARHEVKPHKVRYYLERRDEAFETKMADVLCVYREVALLRESQDESHVAIISYDEKPGIQAIGNTAPDLPPQPGSHPAFARDHEYKRHGTLSLLAGIDLMTGQVHASIEDRHRSREFIGFLKKLDTAYPADTAIKVILDNHSAHISKETKAWVESQPEGRFSFIFTPKHGSWLNLVEGFFSKMARSMLRHIRVASKAELKARILAYLDDINRDPVIHHWTYKIDRAA